MRKVAQVGAVSSVQVATVFIIFYCRLNPNKNEGGRGEPTVTF